MLLSEGLIPQCTIRYFTPSSGVCNVGFQHVFVCWVKALADNVDQLKKPAETAFFSSAAIFWEDQNVKI